MTRPFCTLVIAGYEPQEAAFRALVDSIVRQQLEPGAVEVIMVDDGSSAAGREIERRVLSAIPDARLLEIEHSGWPCRPRNVGIDNAQGEFVLFVDQDDLLFSGALAAARRFAARRRFDVINPNEVRTRDWSWGLDQYAHDDLRAESRGIDVLRPMTPHKLYRRSFLNEHGIRFLDEGRLPWEDVYFNLDVWAGRPAVGLMAQATYHWVTHSGNSSAYSADRDDFALNVPRVAEAAERLLRGDDLADFLADWYRLRALNMVTSRLADVPSDRWDLEIDRAARFAEQHVDASVEALLNSFDRRRSAAVRARDRVELRWLGRVRNRRVRVTASSMSWEPGTLVLSVGVSGHDVRPSTAAYAGTPGLPRPLLRARGDRRLLMPPAQVSAGDGVTEGATEGTTQWRVDLAAVLASQTDVAQRWALGYRWVSPYTEAFGSVLADPELPPTWVDGFTVTAGADRSGRLILGVGTDLEPLLRAIVPGRVEVRAPMRGVRARRIRMTLDGVVAGGPGARELAVHTTDQAGLRPEPEMASLRAENGGLRLDVTVRVGVTSQQLRTVEHDILLGTIVVTPNRFRRVVDRLLRGRGRGRGAGQHAPLDR